MTFYLVILGVVFIIGFILGMLFHAFFETMAGKV